MELYPLVCGVFFFYYLEIIHDSPGMVREPLSDGAFLLCIKDYLLLAVICLHEYVEYVNMPE